jgi:uncharacterized protein YodC (DUF2158 family)
VISIFWGILCLIVAVVFAILAAMASIVLVRILLGGPRAAVEAYKNGANLRDWFYGRPFKRRIFYVDEKEFWS